MSATPTNLITRADKGSKLTIAEMDGNLTYLDNKRPYKVYTALLTQSGGDSDAGLIDNGIVVGVTYRITPYGNEIGDLQILVLLIIMQEHILSQQE